VSDVNNNTINYALQEATALGFEIEPEKYQLMFRWSQNGKSRSTEPLNLSGEEFLQSSTATKT